jgi:hypothetical protein
MTELQQFFDKMTDLVQQAEADAEARFKDDPKTRSYVVGLPVIVYVNDNGQVIYEVDTSETSAAMSDAWWEHGNLPDDEPSAEFMADMKRVEEDHDRRHTPTI